MSSWIPQKVKSFFGGSSPIEHLQQSFPNLPSSHIRRVFNIDPVTAESTLTRHAVDLNRLSETFSQIPADDLWTKFAVCKFDLNRASVYISDQLSPRNFDQTRTQQQQGFGSSTRKAASHGSSRELEALTRLHQFLPAEYVQTLYTTKDKKTARGLADQRNREIQSLNDKYSRFIDKETIWSVYKEKGFNKDLAEIRLNTLKITQNSSISSQSAHHHPSKNYQPSNPSTSHSSQNSQKNSFSVDSDFMSVRDTQDLERLFKDFPSLNRSAVIEAFKANSKLYKNTKAAINRMIALERQNSKTSGNSTYSKEPVASRTRSQSSRHQDHVDDHYSKETVIVEEDSWKETTNYLDHPDILAGTTMDNFEELLILEQRLTMTLGVFKESLPANSLESHKGFLVLQELVSNAKEKISGLISGSLSVNSGNLFETYQLLEEMQRKNLKKVLEINCTDKSNTELLIELESKSLNVLTSPFVIQYCM
ncbi:hypothetical protein GEMRC1_003316 [Eukaryota sp. GEM-RC1]